MNFLNKLFKSSGKQKEEEIKNQSVALSLDDSFVHNFIKLGGKFLYCLKEEDVTVNIQNIITENNWETISFKDNELAKLINSIDIKTNSTFDKNIPFFTSCEQLISENGSILFSSNQIEDKRISELTNDFIVYATTSQIVKNTGDSLTGIRVKHKNNLPANISSIKNYGNKSEDSFMSYGNSNSKNLYLLLLEDL
jgi:L-lactate utilization protein LutC